MAIYTQSTRENHTKANSNVAGHNSNVDKTFHAADNRVETVVQKKLQEAANNSPGVKQLMA